MRKETSSNSLNQKEINSRCSLAYVISLIGGRWKPTILWLLMDGKLRYSELKYGIENISERVLSTQLRELERDQLINRTIYPGVPPKVEYEMSELGKSLEPALRILAGWGDNNRGIKRIKAI